MAADRFDSIPPELGPHPPREYLEWQQRIEDRVEQMLWARQRRLYTPDDDEDRAWEHACDEVANETRNSQMKNGHPAARSTLGLMLRIPRFSQSPNGTREQNPTSQLLLARRRSGWPMDALPTELFEKIAGDLARDDILNMRLVNHEFEKKVSGFLFKAVVVPFRRQIYGITTRKMTSKKAAVYYADEDTAEENGNKDGPHDHDGMEVFKAWGPHIKKFAISFEFDESEIVLSSSIKPSELKLSIAAVLTSVTLKQTYSTILLLRTCLTSIALSGGNTPGIAHTTPDIPPVRTWKTRQTRIARWSRPSLTSRRFLNWVYRWMVV